MTITAEDAAMEALKRIADLSERWADSLVSQINEISRAALNASLTSTPARDTGPTHAERVAYEEEILAAEMETTRLQREAEVFCTSTHCERRQECASPHECSGNNTGKASAYRQLAARDHVHPAPAPKAAGDAMVEGVLKEIAAERVRQIFKGHDAAHDDEHDDEAIAYQASHAIWPNNRSSAWLEKELPRRNELIQGIALAVAEVERMDRAALAVSRAAVQG